ncbi:efflux RND transporter periplasmic adaptor subunit [Thalassoglobus sp.]|uniref:efflux RND transporter periplasmic adaptor subunit n=1 Tax=Thalassoglobus sp. TaxID=2795869 RepID=UPI003AA867A3
MLESLLFLLVSAPVENPPAKPIPVQSAVVSLIDDVDLAFGETGIVEKVYVSAGDQIRKGDLLAELNSTDAELEINRVHAELEMAKLKAHNDLSVQLTVKALGLANAELSRAVKANEEFDNTVSASEIDRLTLSRDEAELRIEQAQHDLEYTRLQVRLKDVEFDIARRKRERRRLRSPIDGVVVKVEHHGGEWAQPDQTFCRIIRTDRVRVEGFVNEADGDVEIGQPVMLSLLSSKTGEPQQFPGTVTFVDPEIDTVTGQYRISAEFENPEGILRAGQRPTLLIVQ